MIELTEAEHAKIEPLESFLKAIHKAVEDAGGDYWQKRRAVAHVYGSEDAKFMVKYMFSTYGYPLEESAAWAGAHGYKLDEHGLEHELLMLGIHKRTTKLYIECNFVVTLCGNNSVINGGDKNGDKLRQCFALKKIVWKITI